MKTNKIRKKMMIGKWEKYGNPIETTRYFITDRWRKKLHVGKNPSKAFYRRASISKYYLGDKEIWKAGVDDSWWHVDFKKKEKALKFIESYMKKN